MPHLMYQNGRLDVLNMQPGHPTNLNCPYRISKRSGDMQIKEWKKWMDNRKEVFGSKRKRSARIGDRMISILQNGESGSVGDITTRRKLARSSRINFMKIRSL